MSNKTFSFGKHSPRVTINGIVYNGFQWEGRNHWAATPNETVKLLDAFKKGQTAKVDLIGRHTTDISLSGFTAIFNDAIEVSTVSIPKTMEKATTRNEAIQLILRYISTGNKFGVSAGDLTATKNPLGKGIYVYAPKTRYFSFGAERLFIWFVKDRQATKLNGATHNLTPKLPYPQYIDPKLWRGTGLTPSKVTDAGLSLAFNR